jgi:hypothetical protein
MADLNREVGEIKAQVRYMTQDVSEIKSDVKSLLADKWTRHGVSMVLAAFVSIIVSVGIEIARAR